MWSTVLNADMIAFGNFMIGVPQGKFSKYLKLTHGQRILRLI